MFNILKFFNKNKQKDLLTANNIFANSDEIGNNCNKDYCSLDISEVDRSSLCDEISILKRTTMNSGDLYSKRIKDFDNKKETILIIDDNEGIVSFLEDDIDFLQGEGIIDISEVNVLGLSGSHAGFNFEIMQKRNSGLNIKWAIIDITLGGSVMTKEGIVKYTGVDVFEILYKDNPDIKFLFYTGNNLNPYIKANKKIIDQFNRITDEDISKYVLFKTSMDMDKRRNYISEFLFNKRLEEN